MSRSLEIVSPSKMPISTSPFLRFRIEDDAEPLVLPDMGQDEVFALVDEFYGASPPRPSSSAPEYGDDEFSGLMDDLDEVEKSIESFARSDDNDLVMLGVASSTHSTPPYDREFPVGTNPAPAAEPEKLEMQHGQITNDAAPSLDTAPAFEPEASATPHRLTNEEDHTEAQMCHTPSPVDTPMEEASPTHHSFDPLYQESSADFPQLRLEPKLRPHQHLQTPARPSMEHLSGSVQCGSIAPSTDGHRLSMQGEMRQEEEDLASGELGSLPPFSGFHTGKDIPNGDAIDLLLGGGGQKETQDLSNLRDIGVPQVSAAMQPSRKKQEASQLPLLEAATVGRAVESTLGEVTAKSLKRGRHISSPVPTPAKRPRRHSPVPSTEPPQGSNKQAAKQTKPTHIEESDSSLTDISLSVIMATTPDQAGELIAAKTDMPLRSNNKERKDSFATSREFKVQAPNPSADEEAVVESTPAKPKATPKRKRNNKPAVKASPVSTKGTAAPGTNASPASAKASKATKATNTAGKGKKSASFGQDLKGIIQAGVLGDVLKNKGPRQTRSEQKKIADTKPDPALAAKRRHTTTINYKV